MSAYKEGDRLRLKHKTDGSEMIGYYRRFSGFDGGFYGPSLILDDEIKHAMVVEKLLEGGKWELEVLESAPVPLPTEQGVYASTRTDCGPDLRPYHLDGRGVWHELDDNGPIVVTRADVAEFAPLKRLDTTS